MTSVSFSKAATKVSLLASAIAGSLLAVSTLHPSPRPSEYQSMQLIDSYDPPQQQVETVDRGTVLALAFGASVAVCLGANTVLGRKGSLQTANQPRPGSYFQSGSDEVNFRQLNHSLQRKLLLLLHQDQQAAERLLKQATLKYPGRTATWYGEKVLYDLERDRGRV